MNETFIPSFNLNKKKWYIIDCKQKQLGRISSSIVSLLCGKKKPTYHPAFDTGDYVILINADDLYLDRKAERFYVFKPGRPGKSLKKLINPGTPRIIQNCISKMMPNGITKRNLHNRLKIYQGSQHPHTAQNLISINDIDSFIIN